MSSALLPGIGAQDHSAAAAREPSAPSGGAARASLEHLRRMRGEATAVDGGLRVFFRTSEETWFWRDVGGGLFEEAERLSGPASVPTTDS